MKIILTTLIVALIIGFAGYVVFFQEEAGEAENTRVVERPSDSSVDTQTGIDAAVSDEEDEAQLHETGSGQSSMGNTAPGGESIKRSSSRTVYRSDSISLPLSGSAPTEDVTHIIPIDEIKRGCFRQDCIPSVDDPSFISVTEADAVLPSESIGIALEYKGETRFYPFPMLETHELVNDVVAGDPLLISYCPLCGTGIVFDRTIDGEAVEFGVSGMLWQSNLLMYNRAEDLRDRNLWSQVLGEAVVGERAGESLSIIPSNIVRFANWKDRHPDAQVLTTGTPRDPYNGDYYGVARNFQPDYHEGDSPLPPTAYVYGIEVNGEFMAYPDSALPVGSLSDTVGGETVHIDKAEDGTVTITDDSGAVIPDVEGFWFSWVAAHPQTSLWSN